jgi:hypothetical protein
VVTHLFGYAEYLLLKKRLLGLAASFLHGRADGRAHHLEVRLQGTADWTEFWRALTDHAGDLNLVMVRLNVNAPAIYEGYHARWDCPYREAEESDLWRAEIPLVVGEQILGRLEISGQQDHQPVSAKIAAMARLVENFEFFAPALGGAAPNPPAAAAENARLAEGVGRVSAPV